ncbi:hypothetical protein GN156_00485 [bacterium LRH843]|nr:hypothetical protein [bacterium LRH843]
MYEDCKNNLYHHVALTMTNGEMLDGIIENVEPNQVTMLVGEDVMEREDELDRQFGGFGRRRFRRFRRRVFPLATIAALTLLPYYTPIYYPYPYYY